MPKNWNHEMRPSDSRVGVFICESFWVIYTSFDVIPLMLGQHQQRDPPPFFLFLRSFPIFPLLRAETVWPLFLGLCSNSQSQIQSHVRLILFVGWGGAEFKVRVKFLNKIVGPLT